MANFRQNFLKRKPSKNEFLACTFYYNFLEEISPSILMNFLLTSLLRGQLEFLMLRKGYSHDIVLSSHRENGNVGCLEKKSNEENINRSLRSAAHESQGAGVSCVYR